MPFLPLLIIFFLLGCTPKNSEAPHIEQHKTGSLNVQRLMHDIENVIYLPHRSEIERDNETRRYLITLSEHLQTMSQKMEKVLSDPNVELCEETKRDVSDYALQLHQHAEQIYITAYEYRLKASKKEAKATLALCQKCHENFCMNRDAMEFFE